MIAFFLSPIGRKVLIGSAIAITFLVALRIYGNRQWAAGRDEGRRGASVDIEAAANRGRDEARAELQTARDAIATSAGALAQAKSAFETDRRVTDAAVRDRLTLIDQTLREGTTHVFETPAGDLPDLIRSLNAEYRTGGSAAGAPADPRRAPRDGE